MSCFENLYAAERLHRNTRVCNRFWEPRARRLCDRVAIIDRGSIVALDTPAALTGGVKNGTRVRFSTVNGFDPESLRSVPGVSDVLREQGEVANSCQGRLLGWTLLYEKPTRSRSEAQIGLSSPSPDLTFASEWSACSGTGVRVPATAKPRTGGGPKGNPFGRCI